MSQITDWKKKRKQEKVAKKFESKEVLVHEEILESVGKEKK